MDTTRTVPADIADVAANWIAGLSLAFEKCQFADDYIAGQAPINADWLCRGAIGLRSPGWAGTTPTCQKDQGHHDRQVPADEEEVRWALGSKLRATE
jgi:hypothetical protein